MQRLLLSVLLLVAVVASDASAGLGTSPSLGPADAGVVDAGPRTEPDAGPKLAHAGVDVDGEWVFDVERFFAIGGLVWLLLNAIAAATPTPRDDEFLRKVAAWFSALNPSDVRRAAGVFKVPLRAPRRPRGLS